MRSERWKTLETLFHEALELQAEERAAFLVKVCGSDEQLRQEVERLIAAHEMEGSFIDSPIFAEPAEITNNDRHESLVGHSIGPYQVVNKVGQGGMGEVYLARDIRLGRKVALKFLPAAFIQNPDRVRRFESEAKAASALNHPNILTIYEIGQAEGLHFIASEFVDGVTLRHRLNSARISIAEALEVAEQVASALSAAHEAGIAHRDIKPENVMLRPDGLVKVLDFGLAKVAERPGSTPQSVVESQAQMRAHLSTGQGVVMGTVSYMSPEQARGLKVDHRTDIFSLGVMLYEMVAGSRPFAGATTSDVLAALLTSEAPPLRQYRAETSPELERIIGKCLAKDREGRCQSAGKLIAELKTLRSGSQVTHRQEASGSGFALPRWPVAAAFVAVLIVGLLYFLYWRGAPAVQPVQIKSLAVLPLQNLSGDPAQEYFADGMTEALITNLAQIRALRVISRTSVMRYKRSRKPLPEIARELNVDAVIEGSVQHAGGRVKVTAQLIQAATDAHMWARDYERELADVLKLQSEVARTIAHEIRIQVTPEEQARLASARAIQPEAHNAYLLGSYHLRRYNEQDLRQAIEHLERAIQLKPDYAAAYAGLSEAWALRGLFGAKRFREVVPFARAAALTAVKLDDQLGEAHAALSRIKRMFDWDWAGAEEEDRRALELDPNSASARHGYAFLLSALGRHTEAIREIQAAAQLDPLSSEIQSAAGRVLYRARKYEEAVQPLIRAIQLDPRNFAAYGRLGDVYVEMGKYDEAFANLTKAHAQSQDASQTTGYPARLARLRARMGRQNEARRMLEKFKATTGPAAFPTVSVAAAYAALGNKDEAFKVLFRLIEERNNLAIFIKEDPPFDSLHSDPRWKELLRRMKFPEAQRDR